MFAAILMRGCRDDPRSIASGDDLLAAMTPFRAADVTGTWRDDRALIAQAIWHNTPESLHESAPEICPDTGRVVAAWVRLDNRDALCSDLGLEIRPSLTDPQIILAAHRAWGHDCTEHLEGDFSFVIYDPERHQAFCARDSMGARPLFFALTETVAVIATSLAQLRMIPRLGLTVSENWVARFLSLTTWDLEKTAFDGTVRLAPGHQILIGRTDLDGPHRFFEFQLDAPRASRSDERWVAQYRSMFDQAVDCRARSNFLIGAESSGGLDSASIAATLAERLPHSRDDFHCFGMCAQEKEISHILATSGKADIRHTHVLVRPRQLDREVGMERAIRVLGHPPEHVQPLMHLSFYELSQQLGIRTLFSGFGGDEVVTHYADWQRWEFWQQRDLRALLATLPGKWPMRLLRIAKMTLRGATAPSAQHRRFVRDMIGGTPYSEQALNRHGLPTIFDAVFDAQDRALTLNEAIAGGIGIQRAHIQRLETYSLFAASYGIEYRWPLLDRRLIQQYYRTPAIEKRQGRLGRMLHRRAVAPRIPPEIAWMPGKDMGAAVGGGWNTTDPKIRSADQLPEPLKAMLDADALHRMITEVAQAPDDPSPRMQTKRLILFQIDVMSDWLWSLT